MNYRNICVLMLAFGSTCYSQSTVTIPFTGTGAALQDPNWTVESHLNGEPANGSAAIVKITPPTWATPAAGTAWIAPNADQSLATRTSSCCQGGTLYRTNINVTDPSTAVIEFNVAAHKEITVWLVRQCSPCSVGNDYDVPDIVYSEDNSTASSPVKVTIKQGASYKLSDGALNTVHFSPGINTIIVEVDNYIGGPTGLYIGPATAAVPAATGYTDAAPSDGSADSLNDPVDSASGQFYDTEVDFRLGGPMRLKFERWYSSQLSKSGVLSALGVNWMGTYDVAAFVKGTKAQVLLSGGRTVTFNNSLGVWQLASPLTHGYQFATAGTGFQFFDPTTQRIFTFNSTGALTKIEDRRGNSLTITPGASGPTKVIDGLGRSLTFTYTNGQLTSVQDQTGRVTSYTYSGGLLASVTDPAKAVTNYTYSSVSTKGLLAKETLPLGNSPVSQVYDGTARVTSQTDGNNNTYRLAYDTLGRTTITDPAGNVTRHTSDTNGNITQITDALGGVTNLTYDSSQRRSNLTDTTGGTTRLLYHPQSGYPSAVTDPLGNTTSYTYIARTQAPFTFYDLSGITYADGKSRAITYDGNGNRRSETRPDGTTIGYTYDAKGQLTAKTNPLGKVTNYTWNADGTVASKTDAVGNLTRYEYDPLRRLSKLTDPNGSTATYTYDSDGRLTTGARAAGRPNWNTHHDTNGQLDSVTNPLGAVTRFTYSPTGKVATFKDPLGNTTSYSYDSTDRLSKAQNALGETVAYLRDRAGRVTSASDATGLRAQFEYDEEDRNTSITDATARVWRFGYDKAGRRTSLTMPGAGVTQFTYDTRGRVTSKTNAVGDQHGFTYDPMGRLMSVTGPDGSSTSFQRDLTGKPVTFTSANGNQWTMAYDDAERLSSLTDPSGNSTKYAYKGARVAEIDYPLGSVNFTYNAAGQVTSADYSDGTSIKKTYDASGLLVSSDGLTMERNQMGLPTSINGIAIAVNAAGRPATLTYAPGKAVTYTYDKAGRISGISDWTGSTKTALTYDAGSRRASLMFPNGVSTAYGYNTDGKRASITYGSLGSITLTLDAIGRVTSADRNLPLVPLLRNTSDTLPQATYDSMGRVTAQGTRTYDWNLATQLTSFSDPGNKTQITYDGLGEIHSSTAGGAELEYVFNYAAKYPALQIVRQGGKDLRYFVYLPDGELLYSIEVETGARRFYHFDEMGNTAFLTDDSGTVTDTYGITPYGEVADHVGTSDNPFTWQGQYGTLQEGDGFYYMRSRHYDAVSARFLSPDPYMNAEPLASEPYAYARANPMLYRDPFGSDSTLPSDIGDLYARFSLDIGFLIFGYVDPQFAFLNVAVALVQANPDADFQTVMIWAYLISPFPLPPEPVVAAPVVAAAPFLAAPSSGVATGLLAGTPIISQDGNSIISQDGNSIISQDGNSIISQDGNSIISDNSEGLISDNGLGLRTGSRAGVISNDGGTVISNDGGTVISNDGGTFALRTNSYKALSVEKSKNKKN